MLKLHSKTAKSRALGTGLGAAFLLAATSAPAATIIVNSNADMSSGDSCTLRDAVEAANTNTMVNGCAAGDAGADIINFAGSGTYTLANGELLISEDVSLNESGQTPTIDAGQTSRIFNNSAALTLTNLTLVNGLADGAGNPANSGGAILNSGTITVMGGAMNNNTALRAGGAIEDISNLANAISLTEVDFSANDAGGMMPAPGNGGALHVTGTGGVVIVGGNYTNNIAANEGGALWNGGGTMDISGTVLIDVNTARGSDANEGGGGIFNEGGTLNIATGTTITNNTAPGDLPTGVTPANGSGGGILNNGGVMTIIDAAISSNSAVRAGGGIEDDRRQIAGTGTVTLNNVTMNGNTTGGNPGNGGAVHVSGAGGTFVVNGGSFTANTAANEGGGLWNFPGAAMNITGATISGNSGNGSGAANGGGGLFNNGGVMSVTDSVVSNNTATQGSGSGGGILNFDGGVLTVDSSEISGNTANRAGGGIETRGSDPAGQAGVTLTNVFLTGNTVNTSPGNGGGLHAGADGSVTVTNSIVSKNTAGLEGGGLWIMDGILNIEGTRISGNKGNGDRVINATSNNADGGGGGIIVNGTGTANITENSLISENTATGTAGSGGGIFNKPGSTVNVSDSTIAGNVSERAGGGIENDAGTVTLTNVTLGGNTTRMSPGNGGGLHTGGAGTVVIDDSAIIVNTATEGGGLWNSGAGTLMVNNSTVSSNQATTGGGVYQDGDGGNTTLNFVTVARNTADGNGGGIAVPGNSMATVNSSIVAENSTSGMDADTLGNVTTTDTVTGSNANLGELRLFGGTTATHPLLTGSPALDTGNDANCGVDPINSADQRAATRTASGCDAGAFEVAGNPIVTVTNDNQGIVNVPAAGADGVTVLAFTLSNNSGTDLTIQGVSGVADLSVPLADLSNVQVLADGIPLAGGNVDIDGRTFAVTFNNLTGFVFEDGDSASYTVTADFAGDTTTTASIAAPAFAGGLLLSLLGLFSVGGLRRRTQWGLLALTMIIGLTACGSGGGDGNIQFPGENQPLQPADLRLIATTIDGDVGAGNDFIIGDGLPVNGPGINFGG